MRLLQMARALLFRDSLRLMRAIAAAIFTISPPYYRFSPPTPPKPRFDYAFLARHDTIFFHITPMFFTIVGHCRCRLIDAFRADDAIAIATPRLPPLFRRRRRHYADRRRFRYADAAPLTRFAMPRRRAMLPPFSLRFRL
jgi:hypothetical protein